MILKAVKTNIMRDYVVIYLLTVPGFVYFMDFSELLVVPKIKFNFK